VHKTLYVILAYRVLCTQFRALFGAKLEVNFYKLQLKWISILVFFFEKNKNKTVDTHSISQLQIKGFRVKP